MRKLPGLVFAASLLMNHFLQAQQSISMTEYMTAVAGDTLVFETSVGREITSQSFIYSEASFRNQVVLKRTGAAPSFRFETLGSKGLEIYLLHKADGKELLPEKPLLFVPAIVKERQTHRDSSRYTLLQNGERQGNGTLLVETQIEGFMSAETPLRNFVSCLIINTKITQKDATGRREIAEWKEWYAKGFGLVNAIVRTYHLDKTGKSSPIHITMYQLERAYVGGKPMEGKIRD